MLAQYQLANVQIRGHSDQQSVISDLWYYTTNAAGVQLKTIVDTVADWVLSKLIPELSNTYTVVNVVGKALSSLSIRTKTNGGVPVYKSTRMNWSEKYTRNLDEPGKKTGPPAPSFVAFGGTKIPKYSALINPATGTVSTTYVALTKEGSIRVGGMLESHTLTTEPNLLSAAAQNMMNNFFKAIDGFVTGQTSFGDIDPSDFGKSVLCMYISKTDNGGPRLNKNGSENPSAWTPAWVASEVRNILCAKEVSSQVSRKRKRNRYA